MQTSRYLVGTFVELTSGMQYGHYNFQCGFLFLFVIVTINEDNSIQFF